jgi:acyl transferase domain-containing protein
LATVDKGAPEPDGIAVIGMQGRFPGARGIKQFWQNLIDGVEAISTFSEAELQAAGIDPAYLSVPGYVNRGSAIPDVDQFDAGFFGYSPRDAETMDPQQRVFLECAWEALEQAGYDPHSYSGMIGVYAGCDQSSYIYQIYANVDLPTYGYGGMMSIGNEKDYLSTQLSYRLNLRGPSMTIQSSCSTSLVAVCMACMTLRHGYCDMALAGGAAISVPQKKGYWYTQGGIESPDGHCRPFDASGQGTVVGCGVGIVLLKRLAEAIRDGDQILAVIKGFGLNNDGTGKVGYTAPSIDGQSAAIKLALRMAGVEPDTIGYVEAHGTATALGDPVEVAALTKAYREKTDKRQFCALGALKSNVGHLSSAAGVSGLIKGVLAVHHGQIPPTLHYRQPNPHLDLEKTPFFVASELLDWPANGHPRRAGVSSFGVGGTNAHLVLEQAPEPRPADHGRDKQVLLLSARSPGALEKVTDNLAAHLDADAGANLADVAYTLQVGRRVFPHRRAVTFERDDRAGLLAALKARDPQRVTTATTEATDRTAVFLFPGQGAQYVGMGADLYRTEPTFRAHLDECCDLLTGQIGLDLRDVLYPASGTDAAAARLQRTSLTQPALFAIEYSLARLWMEWGMVPRAMLGHSIGEYVAACLAGVMDLPDAVSVVAMRGRLMDSMPGGSMLAVPLPEAALQPYLHTGLSLAAVNAPSMSVLAGSAEVIAAVEAQLVAQGLPCKKLHTSHAFHSAMMDPIVEQFVVRLKNVRLRPPEIPYLSNVTGGWATPELATSPEYWGYHLRQTVRFSDNLREVMAFPDLLLLEVGPGQTLGMLARMQGSRSSSQLIVPSLPGPHEKDQQTDSAFITRTIGQVWLGGGRLDWDGYHRGESRRRVALPTYPFERQRYWLGPVEEVTTAGALPAKSNVPTSAMGVPAPAAPAAPPGRAGRARDVGGWFWAPTWKAAGEARQAGPPDAGPWLVFGHAGGLGGAVRTRLQAAGAVVNLVAPGRGFARRDGQYELDPGRREDYHALVQELKRSGEYPTRVLHLWGTDGGSAGARPTEAFDTAQDRSFCGVTYLAQALGRASATAAVQIGVVTEGLHAVTGDEALRSDGATVLGACKVISQEYPNLRCRNVDVVTADGVADVVVRELSAEPFQAVVAYRQGRRWVEGYERIRLDRPAGKVPILADGDVCLITGGLGNIALLMAESIAADVKARFVLTGRSAFPPHHEWDAHVSRKPSDPVSAKIRRLLALERTGSEVLVVRADAADRGQMAAAVAAAVARWGAIHGVIHGAANLDAGAFGPTSEVNRAAADAHFRPKAHGLLVLDELTRDQPLKFCLLLSSLSAVLGGLGLACYAASNAYLDVAAQQRNRRGSVPWITVNWDAWSFAPGPTPDDAIGPAEGQDCFRRVLASSLRHVVVAATPLDERLAKWVELRPAAKVQPAPAANNGAAHAGTGSTHARPSLGTQFVAPRTETEKAIAAVWENLLGVAPIGIHDKFFELGGHSLLAVQLLARLREMYNLDLPVQRIFEAPTIAQLAEGIDQQRKASTNGPAADDPGLEQMLKLVEGLSEAELEVLLAEVGAPAERTISNG